jgi:hypothetical protein
MAKDPRLVGFSQEDLKALADEDVSRLSPKGVELLRQLQEPRRAFQPPTIGVNVPEVIRSREAAASPTAALRAGVPTDPKAQIAEFAKARGIPESRYTVIGGDIFYLGDDQNLYAEVPGVRRAPMTSAAFAAPAIAEAIPPLATSIATSPMLLGGPGGAAASIGLTGAAGAAGTAARQGVASLLGDQPMDTGAVVRSGLGEAALQAVPYGIGRMAERAVVRDIGRMNPQEVADLQRLAQQQGIQLTPGELTNLQSLKSQQKVLGNIPASQDVIQEFYSRRFQTQIQPAVDNFLSRISMVDDPMVAGARGQQALQARRQQLVDERKAATEPLYEQAFENAAPVDIKDLASQVDRMTRIAKGEELRTLQRIRNDLNRQVVKVDANGNPVLNAQGNPELVTVLENRPQALQRAKFSIDQMLQSEAASSMDNVIRSDLTNIQKTLVNKLESEVPGYAEANRVFADLSKPINEFDTSRSGLSLTKIGRDNLDQFAERVFGPAARPSSPNTIRATREYIIQSRPDGEEIWNDVTRAYLEDVWQRAMKPAPGATEQKVDAGLAFRNILMGDTKRQESLRAALTPQQFVALSDLTKVLEAAGRVKKLGSDTAFNQEIIREMQKSAPGALATGARWVTEPLKTVRDFLQTRAFENNASSLAQIVTSPDGIQNMRELRRLRPTQAKFWATLTQSLAGAGAFGAEAFMEE